MHPFSMAVLLPTIKSHAAPRSLLPFFCAEEPCGARQWFFFFSKYASTRSAHKSRHQAEVLCCLDYMTRAVVGWSSANTAELIKLTFFAVTKPRHVPYIFRTSSFLIIFYHLLLLDIIVNHQKCGSKSKCNSKA